MSLRLDANSGLISLVKSLAEQYSDFNAYITYIYRVYGKREDAQGIKIRSSLITMRSYFITCVEGLARITSTSKGMPYPSLLAEVKMYISSVGPQVEAIAKEYAALSRLVEEDGGNEAVRQLGEIVSNLGKLLEELRKMN